MDNEAQVDLIAPYQGYFSVACQRVVDDLGEFERQLIRWQRVQNLVSRETIDDIWRRHFCDSLQLLRYIPGNRLRIADIGSGGGFPAIPLAIALRNHPIDIHLIESNSRKVSFLRAVSRELKLGLIVHGGRVENIGAESIGPVDIFTSRATARLDKLFGLVKPLWGKSSLALFHKGNEFSEELCESRANWRFDVVENSSEMNMSGVILEIRNLISR